MAESRRCSNCIKPLACLSACHNIHLRGSRGGSRANMASPSTSSMQGLAAEFAVSGISVGFATMATNPLDVIKTRLQLQRLKLTNSEKPPGLMRTGIVLVKQEGMLALWSGLPPALARGFLYGGLRLGLYSPIKSALYMLGSSPGAKSSDAKDKLSFAGKLAAGSLSGGLAAAVTNPTELVKTRLQTKGNVHSGSIAIMRDIIAKEGVVGLWRGAVPGMTRAALVTACQCGTYDEIKRIVLQHSGWGDSLATHFTSSTLAGLIATTATNPIDVVKTVVFVSGNKYSGPMAAAADILRTDGPRGFFKGWVANFSRLGPQTVLTFLANEALRSAMGMKAI